METTHEINEALQVDLLPMPYENLYYTYDELTDPTSKLYLVRALQPGEESAQVHFFKKVVDGERYLATTEIIESDLTFYALHDTLWIPTQYLEPSA